MSIKYHGQTISGPPGVGVPAGGTTDQILSKASDSDYDTQWVDKPAEYEAGKGVTFTDTETRVSINVTCPIVPITNEAYNALTEDEKNAEIAYLIVDADE